MGLWCPNGKDVNTILKIGLRWCLLVCAGTMSCSSHDESALLQDKIDSTRSELTKAMAELSIDLVSLEQRMETQPAMEASLNPYTANFTLVTSQFGTFMVACEGVEPFGDGQKLSLRIGNPHYATFDGVEMKVRYGRRAPEVSDSSAVETRRNWWREKTKWNKELRTQHFSFPTTIHPGAWNAVPVILAPATSEDIGFVGITLEFRTVSLKSNSR